MSSSKSSHTTSLVRNDGRQRDGRGGSNVQEEGQSSPNNDATPPRSESASLPYDSLLAHLQRGDAFRLERQRSLDASSFRSNGRSLQNLRLILEEATRIMQEGVGDDEDDDEQKDEEDSKPSRTRNTLPRRHSYPPGQ